MLRSNATIFGTRLIFKKVKLNGSNFKKCYQKFFTFED